MSSKVLHIALSAKGFQPPTHYLKVPPVQRPSVLAKQHLGCDLEIGVIVDQRHVMCVGMGGD